MKQRPSYKHFLVWVLLAFAAAGCREEYHPELDEQAAVLVVDGQITNLPGPAYVKLFLAKHYNAGGIYPPVTGARVMIYESPGGTHWLKEIEPGYYITDTAEFQAVPWKTYTLRIETRSNSIYESKPQLLLPPAETEGISGILGDKEYITTDLDGNATGRIEQSVETFVSFRSDAGPDAHFRFQTQLMVGSSWIDYSTIPFPTVNYNWKKLRNNIGLNITGADYAIVSDSVSRYSVNYFPLNRYFYDLAPDEWPQRFFLQLRQYTLNDDALKFYREVRKQVSATGKLFDPIATQVGSNIECISDGGKTVLGFFEVSSCVKHTYLVKPLTGDNRVEYKLTWDMDSIPETGTSAQDTPYFWN